MNRRKFFGALTGGIASIAAAFTLNATEEDPEGRLWKPNEKTIFIPNMTYVEHHALVANGNVHDHDCLFIKHWQMMMDLGIRPYDHQWSGDAVRHATPQEVDAVKGIKLPGIILPGEIGAYVQYDKECHSKANYTFDTARQVAGYFRNAGIIIPGFAYNPEEQKVTL